MKESKILNLLTEYNDLSTSDLALLAGKSVTTIRRWKRKYGFNSDRPSFMTQYRCPKRATADHDTTNWDTKDWLYQKYIVEGLGITAIGNLVGKAAWSISVRLKRHGIPIQYQSRNKSQNPFCNKPWLAYHYCGRRAYLEWCEEAEEVPDECGGLGLSLGKCAEIAGVSPYTIYNWLSKFSIYIRSKEEARAAARNPEYDINDEKDF